MNVNIQDYSNVMVFKLEGVLSVEATESLQANITQMVASQRKAIVFDMTDVQFIDSQGLDLLLWVRDYCRLSLVQFRLSGLDDNCQKILEITRLNREFNCSNEVIEAVKSLA